jgi:hypothetical protein
MQSSDPDQQPRDEEKEYSRDDTEKSRQLTQQEAQPLYEFPASGPLPSAGEVQATADTVAPPPTGPAAPIPGAINRGFVYPPPPSYYQNMPSSPVRPPLPQQPSLASNQGSRQATLPDYNFTPITHPRLPSGNLSNVPPPTFQPYRPAQKKSYKWVWIAVSIISICVLTGCSLGVWGIYTIINASYQEIAGSIDVVNDYYSNLQSKNYTAAYSDLAPHGQISGLTQAQFVKEATQLEQQYGPVISFVPSQPNLSTDPNTGTNFTHLTITVDVKRTHDSYTALLTLDKIGGNWKITEYDRI